MSELHNYEARLRGTLERIARDPKIREADKRLISDYIDHCGAQGHCYGRRFKLAWTMQAIAREMPTSFKAATRKDIEKVVAWVNSSSKYSPSTKSDLKKIFKHFYRFVRYGNVDKVNPYPPEVAWIPTSIKRSDMRSEEVITEDEARRMIDSATSLRDKAIISTVYEGGFRIGELLSSRVGSLTFNEVGCRVQVERGKTGPRSTLLIASAPILARYLDSHPFKNYPDAPLWIGQRRMDRSRR